MRTVLKLTPELFMDFFRNGEHQYHYTIKDGIPEEAKLEDIAINDGVIVVGLSWPTASESILVPEISKIL